ncbi:transposase [Deltaproteobacteria bacterium TL4]
MEDPPRRRANKRVGLGTMENDRPPIAGIVGRTSGKIRLDVCQNTQQKTIQPQIEQKTQDTVTLYTDESSAYNKVAATGRSHATVCHSKKEYARDDDGDGFCKSIVISWKAFGPDYETSYDPSEISDCLLRQNVLYL